MDIEIGDIVQIKGKTVFGGLRVLAVEGKYAICSYYVLDKPLDGLERPKAFISEQGVFPLDELVIWKKQTPK
jgi:hypothetical protein